MEFKELNFTLSTTGTQALVFFDNGLGASVITGECAYTSEGKPYELAVIAGNSEYWNICYTTGITDDVIGHLSESEICDLLNEIRNLDFVEVV